MVFEISSSKCCTALYIVLQPCAHRPARMEVPVQLQTTALVSVGLLDSHVNKVHTQLCIIYTSLVCLYDGVIQLLCSL